jgi:hypothetical protein
MTYERLNEEMESISEMAAINPRVGKLAESQKQRES